MSVLTIIADLNVEARIFFINFQPYLFHTFDYPYEIPGTEVDFFKLEHSLILKNFLKLNFIKVGAYKIDTVNHS